MDTSNIDWLFDEEHGFVLFFRPRCGSTTLTRWFFENKGVQFTGFSIAAYRNEWLQDRVERLQSELQRRYADLHRFVVVRDPVERAVSSYLHVVNNEADYQWKVVKPHVAPAMEKHDLTFREFVEFMKKDDLDNANLIWRRQSSMSCWEMGGVDDVVRLADMSPYLERMNKQYGLTATPGFNSVTVKKEEKVRRYWFRKNFFGDTPFRELLKYKHKKQFKHFPDYSLFYDEALMKDVRQLYAEDIAIYDSSNGER